MKNIIPRSFAASRAADFVRGLSSDRLYLFIGDNVPNPADTVASEIADTENTRFRAFDNMIQGQYVPATNVSLMVPRIVWASGTIYPEYTHLASTVCHVVVESGSTYNIYKCLDNRNGAVSTAAPAGTNVNPTTGADGYVWKYLFSVVKTTYDKFVTTSWMPFVANVTQQSAAVRSAIDVIQIDNGGVGYTNYFTGQLRTGDIVSTTQFKLIENASNLTNFYRYCILKITDPASPAYGQYRRITGYSVAGAVKTITIESAFSAAPVVTNTYEIYPEVLITSSNANATPAMARAIINPNQANTVSDVEILTPGANHRGATASVRNDSSVTITTAAALTPIISPSKGHGGDPLTELGGNAVTVWGQFAPLDTALVNTNEFRQFGLIRNPRFDNVLLTVSGTGFANAEQVIQHQAIGVVSSGVTLAVTTLTGNSTATFLSSIRSGDSLLVSNATASLMTVVSAVTNNTSLTTSANVGAMTAGTATLVRLIGDGTVLTSNTTSVTLSAASSALDGISPLYGSTSTVVKIPTAVTFNTKANSSTFVQASRIVGTMTSGTFVQDEKIVSSTGSGYIYSIDTTAGTTTVYLTAVEGTISTGTITGQTSGAVMNISAKYNGDISSDRGQVMYLENVAPVARLSNKTETFKIVLEL